MTQSTLRGTPEHPFFAPEQNTYIPLRQLQVGTALQAEDSSHVWVSGQHELVGEFTVYNVEVEDDHNYFVAANMSADAAVLVHNACSAAELWGTRTIGRNTVANGQYIVTTLPNKNIAVTSTSGFGEMREALKEHGLNIRLAADLPSSTGGGTHIILGGHAGRFDFDSGAAKVFTDLIPFDDRNVTVAMACYGGAAFNGPVPLAAEAARRFGGAGIGPIGELYVTSGQQRVLLSVFDGESIAANQAWRMFANNTTQSIDMTTLFANTAFLKNGGISGTAYGTFEFARR